MYSLHKIQAIDFDSESLYRKVKLNKIRLKPEHNASPRHLLMSLTFGLDCQKFRIRLFLPALMVFNPASSQNPQVVFLTRNRISKQCSSYLLFLEKI